MNLINSEESHFFGIYDNDKYYVNKTTSKKPNSNKSTSRGTSKSTSKPNTSSKSTSSSSSKSTSSSSSKSTSSSSSKSSSSSSSSSSKSSSSSSKSSSSSSSSSKSSSGSSSSSGSRSSSSSGSGYKPSSGSTPTAIKNADNRNTGYSQASSGYKPSTSSSSKGNNITGATTKNNFLGGYTGSQVRSNASSSSSSGYKPSSGSTPTAIKNADNRNTGYSQASSGYKPSTGSSSKSNNITGTTTRNNFLGGYTGSQVRSNASNSTTVKKNTSPTFNATANVNTKIAGLDYLQKNNVSYLEYTRRNGTTTNGQFTPKIFVQDYDLGADAANRGKTISSGSSNGKTYSKIDAPTRGGFLGGYTTAQVRKDIASSNTGSNTTNNTKKEQNKSYSQVKAPSGGGFLGGYTGSDVLKDAGVTPKKPNGSIFTKIGNFFKDPIGTITKKNNSQNTTTNISSNNNGGTTSKKLTSEVTKGTLDRLNAENVSSKPSDPFKSVTGRDSLTNFTEADVERLAALMFREAGGSFVHGSDEEWFAFLNSGAVALNNAYDKGVGDNFSDRLTSLSNNVYQGLSSYATSDFDTVTSGASDAEKADLKNAARLVLSGQYTLPSNMHLQASESIVKNNGTSWNSHGVDYDYGYGDIHIGYDTGSAPASTDIYGNATPSDVGYYQKQASQLRETLKNSNSTNNISNTNFSDIREI